MAAALLAILAMTWSSMLPAQAQDVGGSKTPAAPVARYPNLPGVLIASGKDGKPYYVNPSTGAVRPIKGRPNAGIGTPSPDGRKIAYVVAPDNMSEVFAKTTILVIDRQGKSLYSNRVTAVCPYLAPTGAQVNWSQSSMKLAIGWSAVLDLNTKRCTAIPRKSSQDIIWAWGPNETVLYTRNNSGCVTSLHTMQLNGTQDRQLTSGYYDETASWSPDGKSMAFIRHHFKRDGQCRAIAPDEIVAMRPDGSGQKVLWKAPEIDTGQGIGGPTFSSDSQLIALSGPLAAGKPNVCQPSSCVGKTLGPYGTLIVNVATGATLGLPLWDPWFDGVRGWSKVGDWGLLP